MKREQNATASSLAYRLLQPQLHIHQMLQSEDTFQESIPASKVGPILSNTLATQNCITPIIKTSIANSDELLQQFLTALTFLTDACRQSWILSLVKTLPLGPWLAFDRAMDGTSWQSFDLLDELFNALRILKVNVLLDSDTNDILWRHVLNQRFLDLIFCRKQIRKEHYYQGVYVYSCWGWASWLVHQLRKKLQRHRARWTDPPLVENILKHLLNLFLRQQASRIAGNACRRDTTDGIIFIFNLNGSWRTFRNIVVVQRIMEASEDS